jgi:hypothetical protein
VNDNEVFHLPARFAFGAVTALVFSAFAVVAWPHTALFALCLFELFAFTALVVRVFVVSIGDGGLVLYRLWRLPWSRVSGVRRISLFGLPYMLVARQGGFSWWVPLYLRGSRPMEAALMARAPEGNPLRTFREHRR